MVLSLQKAFGPSAHSRKESDVVCRLVALSSVYLCSKRDTGVRSTSAARDCRILLSISMRKLQRYPDISQEGSVDGRRVHCRINHRVIGPPRLRPRHELELRGVWRRAFTLAAQ